MIFPLTGKLIDGRAAYKWLANNAINVNGQISICSAFLRSSILEDFSRKLPSGADVRVLARWRLEDLLSGASDMAAYEFCRKLGWSFSICTYFHGKVFVFPPAGILLGSANATGSGLGLLSNSNSEVCTVVQINESNKSLVEGLFLSGTKVTDELFENLKNIYENSLMKSDRLEWPDSILRKILPSKEFEGKLFLSECLASNGDEILNLLKIESSEAKFDASLLSLPTGQFSREVIAKKLTETKIFQLLRTEIKANGGEIYFGALTAAIHSHLIEDPVPYRRDVKVIVKNLYSWVSHLEEFLLMKVDRPNYSERIRIA